MPEPFKGPLYYPMQGVHYPPFGLSSITHRESHEHISEKYHFKSIKCTALSILAGTLTKRSYENLEAIIDIQTTYTT